MESGARGALAGGSEFTGPHRMGAQRLLLEASVVIHLRGLLGSRPGSKKQEPENQARESAGGLGPTVIRVTRKQGNLTGQNQDACPASPPPPVMGFSTLRLSTSAKISGLFQKPSQTSFQNSAPQKVFSRSPRKLLKAVKISCRRLI